MDMITIDEGRRENRGSDVLFYSQAVCVSTYFWFCHACRYPLQSLSLIWTLVGSTASVQIYKRDVHISGGVYMYVISRLYICGARIEQLP